MKKNTVLSLAVLLAVAIVGCQPANPVLEIEGGKIQGVESSAKDASAMGAPLKRR